MDMPDIVKTVTKKAWSVLKAEDIVDVMKEAFYLMREGRPGPVLVELPLDVQKAELDFDIDSYVPMEIPVVAPDMDKIKEAGYDVITPVIVCNTPEFPKMECLSGMDVKAGETTIIKL